MLQPNISKLIRQSCFCSGHPQLICSCMTPASPRSQPPVPRGAEHRWSQHRSRWSGLLMFRSDSWRTKLITISSLIFKWANPNYQMCTKWFACVTKRWWLEDWTLSILISWYIRCIIYIYIHNVKREQENKHWQDMKFMMERIPVIREVTQS